MAAQGCRAGLLRHTEGRLGPLLTQMRFGRERTERTKTCINGARSDIRGVLIVARISKHTIADVPLSFRQDDIPAALDLPSATPHIGILVVSSRP